MPITTPTLWLAPHKINTTDSSPDGDDQTHSQVIALTGGRFFVAWMDTTNFSTLGAPDIFGRFGTNFGNFYSPVPGGGDYYLNSFQDFEQGPPAIAARPDGTFVLVYQTHTDPIFNLGEGVIVDNFDNTGFGVFNPNGPWINSAADEFNPVIAAFADGSSAVVFEDNGGGDRDLRCVLLSGTGVFGTEFDIATGAGDQVNADVAILTGTHFVTVYETAPAGAGNIAFKIHQTNGAEVTGGTVASGATSLQSSAVAVLTGGGFVAVWEELAVGGADRDIKARIYTSAGVALPGNPAAFTVNTTLAGNQITPTLAALSDGGFAVVWDTGAGDRLRGQRFDASGVKVGAEFTVASGGGVSEPDITLLGDGRLAVSFTKTVAGNSDIYLAIFDPRETVIDGTAGADNIVSRLTGATINGLDGNDALFGVNGADTLNGGNGDDTLRARNGDDTLNGGAGRDNLRGEAGTDTLDGGADNDVLSGGAGGDQLIGGTGANDSADYRSSTGVTVALDLSQAATGEALGDTFSGIERVLGSNTAADDIRGSALADGLWGYGGGDILDGRSGNDRISGGAGIDILTGGAGADRFEFGALSELGDSISDFTAVDDSMFLLSAAFGGITTPGVAAAFATNATDNVAPAAGTRFIFEVDDTRLWYDPDGTGASAAVLIAGLQAAAAFTAADIVMF